MCVCALIVISEHVEAVTAPPRTERSHKRRLKKLSKHDNLAHGCSNYPQIVSELPHAPPAVSDVRCK